MFPYLVFISMAALAMGILNSMRAFAAPAFSPVFFNLFIIGCALFLSPTMEQPILGVAIGVVAGGAAQFAMQLPGLALRNRGSSPRFEVNAKPIADGSDQQRRLGLLPAPTIEPGPGLGQSGHAPQDLDLRIADEQPQPGPVPHGPGPPAFRTAGLQHMWATASGQAGQHSPRGSAIGDLVPKDRGAQWELRAG